MAVTTKIEGMDELNRELQRLAKDVAPEALDRAAFAAGLVLQGAAQRNVPVEFGNLRASAYTQGSKGSATRLDTSNLKPDENLPDPAPTQKMIADVGFTARYAVYVHENMEQTLAGQPRPSGLGTYWNPGGPKFLERALNKKSREIRDIFEAYLAEAIR